MSDDTNFLEDIVTQAAALPLEGLVKLGERIAEMIQVRTPESVLRAGEQAVDLGVDQLEDARFGKG
jgi:hypothetical protein